MIPELRQYASPLPHGTEYCNGVLYGCLGGTTWRCLNCLAEFTIVDTAVLYRVARKEM
jgi:hypothetical protein